MDGKHPNTYGKRPKRRKDKDNPYELFTLENKQSEPLYYIRFKDGEGVEHCIQIEAALFALLDRFELEDLHFLNEQDRHRDLRDLSTARANDMTGVEAEPVEAVVLRRIQYAELHSAIDKLTAIQRRRISLYYFGGFSLEEIAKQDGKSLQAISASIQKAEKNLKKLLTKG